jgi:hypothetical protein
MPRKTVPGPRSYTTLWAADLCQELKRAGLVGQRPPVLYGGPHTSMPSFLRMKVAPGDRIYPVRLFRARVYVLTRIEVDRIDEQEHSEQEHNRLAFADQSSDPWHVLCRSFCAFESVRAASALPVRFDAEVPYETLERWTYTSQRGERGLKPLQDGGLRSVHSLHGIFRLKPETAAELDHLLNEG